MIFLRILSKSESQIEEIALLLLKEKLGIDANLKRHLDRLILEGDALKAERVYLLTVKTKALLFPSIDRILREKYPDTMPEIYSLPIIHMDWDQSLTLTRLVKEV